MKHKSLEDAIKKAEEEIDLIEKSPFSKDGFNEFKSSIDLFIKALLKQSATIAEQQGLRVISDIHVKSAVQYLARFQKNKWKDIINMFAGLFIGATFSNIINYLFMGTKPTTPGIVFTSVCGMLGAFLVGLNLKDDLQ